MNFDFGKILYEALFSISRGYKDIGGVFGWGVTPSSVGLCRADQG